MTLRKLLAQAMMLAVVAGSIFATSAAPITWKTPGIRWPRATPTTIQRKTQMVR